MEFNKVIAVTGKPGLFEIISQTKTGVIVRSIVDGKRFPIAATHNVSLLENIAIYTYEEEVPLAVILKSMAEKQEGKEALSHKESNDTLMAYFEEILPGFDKERVYASNIKKVIQWYNTLAAANFDFNTLQKIATPEETK
ncbi:DUF5606 domain-containing protein [Tenacibaculum finnmarkense genomovar finnmarkense]|uniref:DUF5606 family protein n=1 Tax=Tenacibaculum finnmarkense TaxID=2781243 RepID=UPI001E3B0DE5|nr:DUF5606 domain-containing protein [Tenacibaculum finnmarkense]MCD8417922.1 DUF5606 domain-containing protein [Tenacibaculum finnmarkense genomovar finnmarkense]MCG8202795.1 DUF5606 domain-containing protein [Tenacibaculum finnmarkense genomovar finnmarkense]MCG8210523.1 DUF5606 domain-containing protein [Tenacibaculum finnmarkense genomovar finnmarkense]MCG8213077.1 DUF5606 domain-containing protein [Tenacibaculum finnmarkense genomovar finnmarkense]MCG8220508.1 DUF5606 domain-containing pr